MSSQFENFDKAYMNALATLHESVSAKYIKKPVEIEAIQITEPEVVHTLQGDITANPSDWIITGVEGEKYPVKDSSFKELYDPCENGKFRKKPVQVTAWKTERELLIPHGVESLKASIGDYIVKQPDGSFAPVKSSIFDKTYDLCED